MMRGLRMVLLMLILAAVVPVPVGHAEPSARAQARPRLSGDEWTFGTPHFLLHYTFTGIDAVPVADADNSSVPDWIEHIAVTLERIWRVQVEQIGWPAPLPDRGEGGDTRIDVYLMELFSKNLGGYVSPDGGFVGDNPHTERIEQQAAYGFLVLDNDYVDPTPPAGLRVWAPEEWVQIIAAHEFNHLLQIAINGIHPMRFFYESTANWMETQVFPDLRDNLDSAGAVFKSPDTCMLRYGGVNRVESGLHWYGMWVFNQMLSETYGPQIIRDIWLRFADRGAYAPFDEVFAERGTTFDDELRRFAQAVLLRDFANGSAYPTARLQEAVDAPGEWTPVDGVQRYAMDYIGLNLRAPYTIALVSEDATIEGIVVGVRGSSAETYTVGQGVTVDFSAYEHAYLIALNLTRPPNEAGCATARYTYAVSEPAPGAAIAEPEATRSVPSFTPPAVEAVTDPEDLPLMDPFVQTEYNIREEIRQVDLPFNPITPRGAPAGFELDSVYGVEAGEVGEAFVALNAPAGGTVAQMLYINEAGEVLRITQSPTIYVTIGEWLAVNRLEFAPGTQIWTTGGVDAAIVDAGARGGRGTLVAFIVKARFIAIDGDASQDAKLEMAARFASSFGMDAELPDPRGVGNHQALVLGLTPAE